MFKIDLVDLIRIRWPVALGHKKYAGVLFGSLGVMKIEIHGVETGLFDIQELEE